MNLPAPTEELAVARRAPRLVALPPLRLERPRPVVDDDDARWWLTTAGAIAVSGIDHVSLVPSLDEIVRWDDDRDRWVRL